LLFPYHVEAFLDRIEVLAIARDRDDPAGGHPGRPTALRISGVGPHPQSVQRI
jgi:hypothetical protein